METFTTTRGLIKYFLLSAITCGIYSLYSMHRVSVELNEVCKNDGKTTQGLIVTFLLTLVTFGIYSIVWWYMAAERMNNYAIRNNLSNVTITGGNFLLWNLLGSLLFGIGPFVALYKFIHSHNAVNAHYNSF